MKLYVGMVTLNCVKYTEQTVNTFRCGRPNNWVVVDNNSSDGTLAFLDSLGERPNFHIIKNLGNRGVAKAWNQIIGVCMADREFRYVWIINNDLILNEKSLDPLVDFVEAHPEFMLVSGVNTRDFKVEEGRVSEDSIDFAAFLLARGCIEKVGLFDENFVLAYFEDNDYHERVKRAGVKNGRLWFAPFYHVGSRTITEGGIRHAPYFEQNKAYFKKKWGFVP